jgi:hypothetical protein
VQSKASRAISVETDSPMQVKKRLFLLDDRCSRPARNIAKYQQGHCGYEARLMMVAKTAFGLLRESSERPGMIDFSIRHRHAQPQNLRSCFGNGAKWRRSTWACFSHAQWHHRCEGHREITQAGVVDQLVLLQQAPKLLDDGTLRC